MRIEVLPKTKPRVQIGRPTEIDKANLIDAAENLFAKNGFEGTTVRDLARRAKCNIALISYHFGSKEGLYHAVLLRHMTEMKRSPLGGTPVALATLREQWPEFSDPDELEFCAALSTFAKATLGNPRMQKIICREMMSGSKGLMGAMSKSGTNLGSILSERLRKMVKERKLRSDLNVQLGAISLIGPIVYSCVAEPILKSVYHVKVLDENYIRSLVTHLATTFFQGWRKG